MTFYSDWRAQFCVHKTSNCSKCNQTLPLWVWRMRLGKLQMTGMILFIFTFVYFLKCVQHFSIPLKYPMDISTELKNAVHILESRQEKYHLFTFQFQLDNTGFFQSISSDSPVPLPDALHWYIDISGSGTGESLEMLWKKPVLSSWNWKRNLVVLGYIWKWNWKKCFNYYGRYCTI